VIYGSSNFNLADALLCAEVSALAYDSSTIESALAHVLIQEFPNRRIVAFRGTNNPMDWLTDARVKFATPFPQTPTLKAHSGFLASMLSVSEPLIEQLKSLPPKPIIITGHSKGAAEARLFAWMHSLPNVAAIYTFGEPRSLNRNASVDCDSIYSEISFRIVHEEDFVARVPWMWGRYRHTTQEIFISSLGGYVENPSLIFKLGSDAYGLFRAWRATKVIGLCDDALRDHFIANYLGAIITLSGVSA
jgi:triacylglycerol lipase